MINKGSSITKIVLIGLGIAALVWVWLSIGGFMESARATEAKNLMDSAAEAQSQLYMRRGRYAMVWTALNSGALSSYVNKSGYVSADGLYLMTNGGGEMRPNKGFKMHFEDNDQGFFVVAQRVHGQYRYYLIRPINEDKVYCVPSRTNLSDKKFCKSFMEVSSESELKDPRDPVPQKPADYWN